eukprot:CAMPEP_0202963918 /NCGR_PEP_ID=MMETSP1396-20130829/7974_1 /ASSEMBLY_ACC=CAM_ASM_000872 /TAXON_ID= /ORGANISM="Pseudokeronopsis sp., Strain Brazil" /LENGTH=42 /DNA_ID= /DNA_START= /DNA_END= /DNA_ORIENTATION=
MVKVMDHLDEDHLRVNKSYPFWEEVKNLKKLKLDREREVEEA